MNSFDTYCTHHALKLHFTTSSYDYFKFHGKVRLKASTFEKRKDRHFFLRINKKYPIKANLEEFFVSILMMNSKLWIGEYLSEEALRYHANRQRICQSLSYTFKEEFGRLLDLCDSPKELLQINGGFPILLDELMGDRISIETVCVLNGLIGFIPYWKGNIQDDLVWPEYYQRITKYSPFVCYDKKKFTTIINSMVA